VTEQERLFQGAVNLVMMLEKMFDMEIKTTADYMSCYNRWQSMGKPINVSLLRSQGVRGVSKRWGVDPKPPQRIKNWDFKKNPIKWNDLMEN